jgi:Family of unknown function (DUF5317)
VFLVAFAALCLITVPLAGGRLSRLADVQLRWVPAIFGSLFIQVVIVSVVPGGNPWVHRTLHLVSYVLAAAFLVGNRRIVGIWVIALGAALNALAIFANNGVMPASETALRAAGRFETTKGFINSGVLAHPKLLFLGDVFSMPRWMPLHNVFSVGDVCIALGAFIAIHTLCGSRLTRRGAAQPSSLALASPPDSETAHRETASEGDRNDGMGSTAGAHRRVGS